MSSKKKPAARSNDKPWKEAQATGWPRTDVPHFAIRTDSKGRPSLWHLPEDDDAVLVSGGLWVQELARDTNGGGWSAVLRFIDRDSKERQIMLPLGMLVRDRREIAGRLLEAGLFVSPTVAALKALERYVGHSPSGRATIVRRTGWAGSAFVLPTGGVCPKGEAQRYVLADPPTITPPAGTIKGWRDQVSALCIGNTRLVLGASVGFASPVMELVGADSGAVHMRGFSSTGKTVALRVGASVSHAGFDSWNATTNGLEGKAAAASGLGLFLDEIGEASPFVLRDAAYMLGNGAGRSRAKQDGSAREVRQWSLLVFSSGEPTMAERLRSAGIEVKTGHEVRFPSIEADAGKGFGVFENLHGSINGHEFAERIKRACAGHHGVAGPAFVRYVVDHRAAVTERLRILMGTFERRAELDGADGQVRRVAARFALIAAAGEVATEAGVTGWPVDEAMVSLLTCFASWRSGWAPSGAREDQQSLERVAGFLQQHASRFDDMRSIHEDATPNRAGYMATEDGEHRFYVFTHVFRDEICSGMSSRSVAKLLDDRGLILTETSPGGKVSRSVSRTPASMGKSCRLYAISARVTEEIGDA